MTLEWAGRCRLRCKDYFDVGFEITGGVVAAAGAAATGCLPTLGAM